MPTVNAYERLMQIQADTGYDNAETGRCYALTNIPLESLE
jgi:hypothetical protein